MGENSEQIGRHIEERRNRLNNNISELEGKLKDAVDWHVQVDKRPMTMLGLAFGAGILLSAIIGGSRRSISRKPSPTGGSLDNHASETARPDFHSNTIAEHQEKYGSRTLDNLKGALAGVAITKCEEFLEELLPGFTDQYHKAEARNRSDEPGSSNTRVN